MTVDESQSCTSISLLLRLNDPDDHSAWKAFVERYAPTIYRWCCRFGIQESDATDVTQEVLIKLVRAMRNNAYNPERGRFRPWLKSVTANAVRDLMRSWSRHVQATGDTNMQIHFNNIQDPRVLAELSSEIEAQYQRELLSEAELRVKARIKEKTWQAYQLSMVEGLTPSEIAEKIDIPVGSVYVFKWRVIKQLRREVELLAGDGFE